MRLRRIDAVRFGSLPPDSSLSGIGDGLTVVVGPNEAGKTSYTTLVRHVLYGFPNARSAERLYLPPNGDKRCGPARTSPTAPTSGWWSASTGRFGGSATVRGPGGDGFLGALTAGVTQDVYRSVFGFGLDELADLGSLKDIQQRLYATAAGLRVDPQEVREQLRQRAEAIWSAQGRTKRVHNLNKELRDVRERIRDVETRAEEFRAAARGARPAVGRGRRAAARPRARSAGARALARVARRVRATSSTKQVRDADAERDELRQRAGGGARGGGVAAASTTASSSSAKAIDELAARAEWFQDVGRARQSGRRARAAGARGAGRGARAVLGPGWDEERVAPVPPTSPSTPASTPPRSGCVRRARQLDDAAHARGGRATLTRREAARRTSPRRPRRSGSARRGRRARGAGAPRRGRRAAQARAVDRGLARPGRRRGRARAA